MKDEVGIEDVESANFAATTAAVRDMDTFRTFPCKSKYSLRWRRSSSARLSGNPTM